LVKSEYLLQSVLKYPLSPHCPHCGSTQQTQIARKYGVARIVRCVECGLYFSRPIYRSWVTQNLYDGLYAAGFATELPDDAQLARWIATGFREIGRDARTALERIRLHLSRPAPALLEIGCSWGYFLHQARAAGFDVTGVEIGASRRDFGRQRLGLRIVADLGELPADRRYDVIYTAHVLEHLTDLGATLARLAPLLRADGLLFAEVPNFGARCFPIVGAVHPLGFDSEFFRANLPRHGLALTGVFSSWDDVPDRAVQVSSGEVIIVRAAQLPSSPPS
jgi:SAM-dependent methyltransferase